MGNARKNTFPDRKDSTVRDVTGSPKSAGEILKELGSVFFRTLATMFFVMVITGCIVACVMTVYIVGFLDDESDLDLNSLEMNYTSILYVQDKSTGEYVELNRLHLVCHKLIQVESLIRFYRLSSLTEDLQSNL